ncbi:hypothetical protein AGRO_5431 [Agrobacterium sp. ATCC 31749]|nr:hypothetical protein AGRO_5431 [Agrobacterium sp. ATCC 31749]
MQSTNQCHRVRNCAAFDEASARFEKRMVAKMLPDRFLFSGKQFGRLCHPNLFVDQATSASNWML